MIHFELAAEVGDLLEAQFKGDLFDGPTGKQKPPGGDHPLSIQPIPGRTLEVTVKLALKLTRGNLDQPGEFPGVVTGAGRGLLAWW